MKKILYYLFGVLFIITLTYIIFIGIVIRNKDIYPKDNTFNSLCNKERYNRIEDKGLFSDKLEAKKYVNKHFTDVNYPKVLYKFNKAEDILDPSIILPEKFVMKSSGGCGYVNLIKDDTIYGKGSKSKTHSLSKEKLVELANKYGTSFGDRDNIIKIILGKKYYEPHYKLNNYDLYIEEFLEDIIEFRLYYAYQKLLFIESENGRVHYDREFNQIEDAFKGQIMNTPLEKPECFNRILKFTDSFIEKTKFNLIRIDLNLKEDGSDFYFNEFTFCPSNCTHYFSKKFDSENIENFKSKFV